MAVIFDIDRRMVVYADMLYRNVGLWIDPSIKHLHDSYKQIVECREEWENDKNKNYILMLNRFYSNIEHMEEVIQSMVKNVRRRVRYLVSKGGDLEKSGLGEKYEYYLSKSAELLNAISSIKDECYKEHKLHILREQEIAAIEKDISKLQKELQTLKRKRDRLVGDSVL